MRPLIGLLFFFQSLISYGFQYRIIEKDNRQGLADLNGTEVIPPVYDKIGWSDGHLELVGELIGYEINGQWGLISIKNKRLSDPVYYSLSAFDHKHIKAAIKGKFSNRLFYGLIDEQGEVQISCNYFNIQPLSDAGFLVYQYNQGSVSVGLINHAYDLIIQPSFERIEKVNASLLAAQQKNLKWIFYNQQQRLFVANGFDKYRLHEDCIELIKNGKHGLISLDGLNIIEEPAYKSIDLSLGRYTPFDQWEIMTVQLDSTISITGDSTIMDGELFVTYLNGNQSVLVGGKDLFGESNIKIKIAKSGFIAYQNKDNGEWALTNTAGNRILSEMDSIYYDGLYFFAMKEDMWDIYNRFGRKLNLRPWENVSSNRASYIPVQRNGYWGFLDFQGDIVISPKFDDIGEEERGLLAVKYLNEWGVMDLFGNWLLKPAYDEITFTRSAILARNEFSYSLFDDRGKILFKTGDVVEDKDNYLLIQSMDTLFGAISNKGTYLLDPVFDKVGKVGPYYYGERSSGTILCDTLGKVVVPLDDGVAEFNGFSEDYFRILKDNRFGFVDMEGRLRIANRYEDAGLFVEGLCAIKINDKWGFIDLQEKLVIQPVFDWVSNFDEGLCIVRVNDRFGLIDSEGKWVSQPKFIRIDHQQNSGYILIDEEHRVGAADQNGNYTLSPNFEMIREVSNGLLICKRNGKYGIMDQQGYTRIPFKYETIEVKGDYFVMKLLTDR
jgi:hypothetical protein